MPLSWAFRRLLCIAWWRCSASATAGSPLAGSSLLAAASCSARSCPCCVGEDHNVTAMVTTLRRELAYRHPIRVWD